ncbi:MAG: ABC transporter permease [Candidatus Atelocyanobacterium sp. ALOHA_A2.5_9]|uniref:ABC-type dipeptide/oligopeptide/nickel transport system, permease component n=2 Tax=Candidatus Atelocyanobacterium thalassae TaxID=713887 RepID=D3ENT0_ATETH|nr:ABC transporter permease [Candidatus Atelocyanobacterium thalassa]ADB95130.1 ABC-type dipeptide/oligopeptide/nickel transport system, permease component [Candidatus Atelocyanobacterium thalassa isolate ALOHA]MCH2543140.1 ABC transporter permease [Candidatus Atelocyanobacterium sp. ALOHA_A2.5_9]|tara:strand:+ start:568 stop:1416 length:849 start_codon:yes stop_codon:yes gene_type:complete
MSPSISTTKKLMRLGIAITLFWLFIALFSPLLQIIGVLQDPTELLSNMPREAPSISHLLGTDIRGYDVLSRTLIGSQAALKVVFLSTIFSLVIGVPSGLISGYLGGKLDKFLMFLMDTIYTIPGLLLSVTLSFILGKGIVNIAIAVSIAYVPQYYRIIRNHTNSIKNQLFIEAAQAIGATPRTILYRYLFLNVIQNVPVVFTLNAADAILVLGGLGFLGLGLPEEVAEWGHDLKEALPSLSTGIWWTTLFPGLAMTSMVVGLSLIGEGISEIFIPSLRNENK